MIGLPTGNCSRLIAKIALIFLIYINTKNMTLRSFHREAVCLNLIPLIRARLLPRFGEQDAVEWHGATPELGTQLSLCFSVSQWPGQASASLVGGEDHVEEKPLAPAKAF